MDVETPYDANAPPPTTIQKVFPMAEGDGEESYTKNSQFQAFTTNEQMLALDETLEKMSLPSNGGPVRVVDLGCSSGPNTIVIVAHIVDKLRHGLSKDAEFQAYFNDVPSNDFNNLFQLLSTDSRAKNFYAAGAPGSFFYRLFPQSSVHIFYSANSLHWLSKVPDAVLDKESPAYNRGNIWYQHSGSAVARAYQEQALLDLKSFFLARAAELVSGGVLFFFMDGRETSEPHEFDDDIVYHIMADLDEILSDLAGEGLLTEQQLDNFSMPQYHRNCEDVREALKCCSSLFNVVVLKVHTIDMSESFAAIGAAALPKTLTGTVRAGLNPLLEAHFGSSVAEVVWERYEKLIGKKMGTRPDILKLCIVGLIRK